jgi:hypothetical protein
LSSIDGCSLSITELSYSTGSGKQRRTTQHDEALWREIEAAVSRFRFMAMDDARNLRPLKALRDAYRALDVVE